MEPIKISNNLRREASVTSDIRTVRIELLETHTGANVVMAFNLNQCQALEAALATARKEATPDACESESVVETVVRVACGDGDKLTLRCGAERAELELHDDDDFSGWKEFLTKHEAAQLHKALTAFIGDAPEQEKLDWAAVEDDGALTVQGVGASGSIRLSHDAGLCEITVAALCGAMRANVDKEGAAEIRKVLTAFLGDAPEPVKPDAEVIASGHGEAVWRIGSVGFHYSVVDGKGGCRIIKRVEAQRFMIAWCYTPEQIDRATQDITD